MGTQSDFNEQVKRQATTPITVKFKETADFENC
jgi:hypothetical protein